MTDHVLPCPKSPRDALVGDTHANSVWTRRVIEELAAEGVDMVVQLGDFGWWPQTGFAKKISKAATVAGITVCFIDGNHEDHEHLRFQGLGSAIPAADQPIRWRCTPACGICPGAARGSGTEFGSGRSAEGSVIDHAVRTPGHDWFPIEEVPSITEAERAIAGGPADVLLSHDFPALGYLLSGRAILEADERASRQVQHLLAKVVEAIEPKLVVHGHWHYPYDIVRHGVTVKGLDCDGTDQAVTVLNLDTLATEDWRLPIKRQEANRVALAR